MGIYDNNYTRYRQVLTFCIAYFFIVSCSTTSTIRSQSDVSEVNTGYSVLLIFLESQKNLTTLGRIKSLFMFKDIDDDSAKLILKITKSSEEALVDLEKLATKKPVIVTKEFADNSIGKATFDSLRITTAKELLFDSENFEKNFLFSQAQLIRVISHLAEELEAKEVNEKRKTWLSKLVKRYEEYYALIYKRITLT